MATYTAISVEALYADPGFPLSVRDDVGALSEEGFLSFFVF
jgi:hypothetical protein